MISYRSKIVEPPLFYPDTFTGAADTRQRIYERDYSHNETAGRNALRRNLLQLFLLFSSSVFANVYVDEINIETEFYGVLNKTRAEFILRNDSEWDNLQGFIRLYVNKTAIVTNMWLEIDGRLERAETLARKTGEQIYDRITRRNIDPAVLTKSGNGSYLVRVFPVNAHSSRRVVIEYVCIVESRGMSVNPVWIFNADAKIKTIDVINKYPSDIDIHVSSGVSEKVEYSGDYFKVSNNREFGLVLGVPFTALAFYNNSSYMVLKNHEIVVNPKYYNCYNAVQLETLIWDIDHFPKYLVKYVYGGNPFIQSFLEYLERKKMIELEYHQEAPGWLQRDKMWTYYDPAFTLTLQPLERNSVDEYYCPFLDVYQDYLAVLKTTLAEQKDKGFLVERLSKLVIEDDRRAQRIWREELEQQDLEQLDVLRKDPPANSPPQNTTTVSDVEYSVELCVFYDEPPMPVGGFHTIQDSLNYPYFIAKHYQGRVVVNCLINRYGRVVNTKVLKPLHPLLDAKAVDVLKRTPFTPAKQRGKVVHSDIWIGIPVIFKWQADSLQQEKAKMFEFNNKEFSYYFNNSQCLEFGFERDRYFEIVYGSDEMFEFLLDNPEGIPYVYLFSYTFDEPLTLGLVIDNQSVMFVKE